MRKWFVLLAVLGLAAARATPQTVPHAIANSLFQVSEDDGRFPAFVYDTPDIVANTTTDYHVTFEWANNDSCLFIGLDGGAGFVGGTSDDAGNDCAPQIQGNSFVGSNSYCSLDGFATAAVDVTNGGTFAVFNLMQRIDWN